MLVEVSSTVAKPARVDRFSMISQLVGIGSLPS
jgi:hypothetical protein